MTFDIHEALSKYADDGDFEVVGLHENKITISVSLPSRGGETWHIKSNDVVHLDLHPCLTLGHIEFGGLSLLPESYIDTRQFDYGGAKDKYRVIRIVDVDDKVGYLVLYGMEEIIQKKTG
jgi:hypothetical protein